ncbi:MAG TPA: hypothetical protein VFM49_12105 [Chloroflexia bacterium]|jgi:hypothetical protein|nr:hypothetical protein [Chloroflexia bacterium]
MILPKECDPRFSTIRRGGALTDADHHLLALWAAVRRARALAGRDLSPPPPGAP